MMHHGHIVRYRLCIITRTLLNQLKMSWVGSRSAWFHACGAVGLKMIILEIQRLKERIEKSTWTKAGLNKKIKCEITRWPSWNDPIVLYHLVNKRDTDITETCSSHRREKPSKDTTEEKVQKARVLLSMAYFPSWRISHTLTHIYSWSGLSNEERGRGPCALNIPSKLLLFPRSSATRSALWQRKERRENEADECKEALGGEINASRTLNGARRGRPGTSLILRRSKTLVRWVVIE